MTVIFLICISCTGISGFIPHILCNSIACETNLNLKDILVCTSDTKSDSINIKFFNSIVFSIDGNTIF